MSESGLPVDPVYGPSKLTDFRPEEQLGRPGEYPFTRGVYPRMYVDRPWTMRQYAGFASARESNQRYHELIEAGSTGLSVAFDLPTQMGYDSDARVAHGEVGKVGVAIDAVGDMRTLFGGIPLDKVSTSMTINAPAAVLLLMYQTVGEEQGAQPGQLTGTIQNDVLKEYIARGTYIYPPRPSLRLAADTFAYCRAELPKWNTISISGYHMAEAGATPVQEIAFTLANAKEYVRAALSSGLAVDDFAPRLSFFFVARTTLLEEVAKFRAARRLWARIMKEEFKAADPRSQMLRFHTQTAGVQLTAQQPEVNLIRVSLQALAAVFGGTQLLHTNSFDEALALPSTKAARLAIRTQQVIANETDLTATADPFAGSYAIESMTDEIEAAAESLIDRVRGHGRRGRGHRARFPEIRDRGLGVPVRAGNRRRRTHCRGREQVRHRRRGAVSAAAPGPVSRGGTGGPAGPAAAGAGPGAGGPRHFRAQRDRGRQRQRPLPAPGRAAGRRNPG